MSEIRELLGRQMPSRAGVVDPAHPRVDTCQALGLRNHDRLADADFEAECALSRQLQQPRWAREAG
jgi:hypothetical protein